MRQTLSALALSVLFGTSAFAAKVHSGHTAKVASSTTVSGDSKAPEGGEVKPESKPKKSRKSTKKEEGKTGETKSGEVKTGEEKPATPAK